MNYSNNKNEKDYSISFVRLTALVFIICCHMMQYCDMELAWWFNVGVQIFLCLSGYIYGTKNISDVTRFINGRLKRILIPYYIAFISYGLLQYFFARDVFNTTNFFRGLIINKQLMGGGHLWFVPTILLCYMVTVYLYQYKNRYVNTLKRFILFCALSFLVTFVAIRFFVPYFEAAWVSCYIIGYCLHINDENEYISKSVVLHSIAVLTMIGNAFQIYIDYLSGYRVPESLLTVYEQIKNYNHVLLGITLFIVLKMFYGKVIINDTCKKCLDTADKLGYHIYLVHQFVILGPFSLMALTNNIFLNILAVDIAVIVLAIMLKLFEDRLLCVISKREMCKK